MKFSGVGTWLALGLLCSASALAEAQQQYGLPGEYVTWRNSPPNGSSIDVTYAISLPSIVQLAPYVPAIIAAANVWNAAGANIQLTTLPTASTILLAAAGSGAPASNSLTTALGAGTYPDGASWNHILSAGIGINTTVAWHTDPNTPAGPGELDLTSYLVREFGFALGLGLDIGGTDPASVMGVVPPSLGVTDRALSAGDIAALQAIYGAPEPATFALFGVGLAALGTAGRLRRRSTPAA